MYFLALLVLFCHLEEWIIRFYQICIQLKLSNVETVYYNRNSYAYCSAIIFLDLDLSVVCHLLHWRLGTCTYFLVVAPLSQCQRQARLEIWMRPIDLSIPICFKLHFSLNSTVPDAPTCTGAILVFTTLIFGTSLARSLFRTFSSYFVLTPQFDGIAICALATFFPLVNDHHFLPSGLNFFVRPIFSELSLCGYHAQNNAHSSKCNLPDTDCCFSITNFLCHS